MGKQLNVKKEINAIRKLFNNSRGTFSRDERDKIRYNLYKKELIYDFLKNKPLLNDDEKRVFKRIHRYLKKLYADLLKRNNYQENYLYGVDQLFNRDSYYKPFEVKSAFNGNYVLYEINDDKIR